MNFARLPEQLSREQSKARHPRGTFVDRSGRQFADTIHEIPNSSEHRRGKQGTANVGLLL